MRFFRPACVPFALHFMLYTLDPAQLWYTGEHQKSIPGIFVLFDMEQFGPYLRDWLEF